MTHTRLFPIRLDQQITGVPWAMLEEHDAQVWANHKTTLVQLANRGGLTPEEAVAIMEDRPWAAMPMTTATLLLKSYANEFNGKTVPALSTLKPWSPDDAKSYGPFANIPVADRLRHGLELVRRLRDGKAVPHRAHWNELEAILELALK